MRQPTVFIVDDDPGMRASTGMLLGSAALSHDEFPSAADFLDTYRPDMPGCLIVDISMPGMNGLDLLFHLRSHKMHLPTIIVSGTGTIPLVVQGMKLGVVDFLEKPADPALLLEKVRVALELDERRRSDAASLEPISRKLATLTGRERELLSLLVRGLSSKQIAGELNIAVKTVENHRAKLMQKTGAMNAADLTRMAMLAGAD